VLDFFAMTITAVPPKIRRGASFMYWLSVAIGAAVLIVNALR
jgi:hypothetical protein